MKEKIALVLSSGGAKGYAHIGVIRAIEEKGYEISSIAGTSMGALVGGLYAAGKLEEAYKWFKSIDKLKMFSLADFKNVSAMGLFDGEYIFEELKKIVGDVNIEDLAIPFSCVAADLETGKEKVFTKGNLLNAIRASISMPMIFTPVVIKGKQYIDGGVVNGLPINRVKRIKGDKILAVNLDTYGKETNKNQARSLTESIFSIETAKDSVVALVAASIPGGLLVRTIVSFLIDMFWDFFKKENLISVLFNSYYIALKHNKLSMRNQMKPDIYFNIDLQGYTTNDFSEAEPIVQLGYTQTIKGLETLNYSKLADQPIVTTTKIPFVFKVEK